MKNYIKVLLSILCLLVLFTVSCSQNSERYRKADAENFNRELPQDAWWGSFDHAEYEGNGRMIYKFTINESKYDLDKTADSIKKNFIEIYKKTNNSKRDDFLEEIGDDSYMVLIFRGSESNHTIEREISNTEIKEALNY